MKSEIKKKLKTPQPPQAKAQAVVIPDKKNENNFILITLAAYLVIGFLGVFHHEMWRDELQTWLVGASSKTFSEFISQMSGQPLLWYLFNFIFSRFTNSPVISQVFHFLISAGSVYLILKYAPFSRIQKVLLCFSYFLLFEYSLIARGYALPVFFLFLFCAFYQMKSKNRYLILGLILVGLSNGTGAEGVMLTIALLGMMVVDYYFSEDASIQKKYKPMQLFICIAIALVGIYIALKFITPPATGTDRSNTWYTGYNKERLVITLRTFWMSLLPVPVPSRLNFWNSNFFYQNDTGSFTFMVLSILSLVIFVSSLMIYSKKLGVALFYVAATGFVLLFCYANNIIFAIFSVRHYGFIFITFIAAAWLAPGAKKTKLFIPVLYPLSNKWGIEKKFSILFTALLAFNTLGGAIAYYKDYSYTFSNIKMTGDYITSHHLDKLPETGFIGYAVSPVSAYSRQPIYFPDYDTLSMSAPWYINKFSFDLGVMLSRISNYISHQHDSVLFISNGDNYGMGDGKVLNNIQFTQLASFSGAIVSDENFYIYLARKFDLNKQLQDTNSYHNPSIVSSILSSGLDLFQKGNSDDAEKLYTTVKERTHGTPVPHLHNYFGMLYSKENKLADAEKEFNTEIALNLQKEEAFFNLGLLYFNNKDYDKAIIAWDSTVAINPKNTDAFNNLGVCYLNFKKDNTKGMSYFEKAVELNPNCTQGYFNILICAQNNNDEQSVIKYVRILVDKGTSINDIKAKGINISDELLQKINTR